MTYFTAINHLDTGLGSWEENTVAFMFCFILCAWTNMLPVGNQIHDHTTVLLESKLCTCAKQAKAQQYSLHVLFLF